MFLHLDNTPQLCERANSSKGWCRVLMESTIQFNIVNKNLPVNIMRLCDSAKLSGLMDEEEKANHRTLRNSTSQRFVFRK